MVTSDTVLTLDTASTGADFGVDFWGFYVPPPWSLLGHRCPVLGLACVSPPRSSTWPQPNPSAGVPVLTALRTARTRTSPPRGLASCLDIWPRLVSPLRGSTNRSTSQVKACITAARLCHLLHHPVVTCFTAARFRHLPNRHGQDLPHRCAACLLLNRSWPRLASPLRGLPTAQPFMAKTCLTAARIWPSRPAIKPGLASLPTAVRPSRTALRHGRARPPGTSLWNST